MTGVFSFLYRTAMPDFYFVTWLLQRCIHQTGLLPYEPVNREGPSCPSAHPVTLSPSAPGENRQNLDSSAPGRKHQEPLNFFMPSLPNPLLVCAVPCTMRWVSEGWKFISFEVWKERAVWGFRHYRFNFLCFPFYTKTSSQKNVTESSCVLHLSRWIDPNSQSSSFSQLSVHTKKLISLGILPESTNVTP